MSETIECTLSQLENSVRQLLTSSLAPNEQPLMCVKYTRGGEHRVFESRQIAGKFVSVFQEAFARSKTKTDAPNRLRQPVIPAQAGMTGETVVTPVHHRRSPCFS